MNGTQPGRQEGARSGSGRSGSKSPVGRGRRVPRADGRTDDRAACQGEKAGVYMRVVKNTLARKALAGTSFESVGPKLKGPLVLAFSKDDPGAAARVVKDFAKAPREARGDARVSRRAGTARRGAREGGESADSRAGVVDAAGRAQGADARSSSRTLAAPGSKLARTARRRTRPETGRGRLDCFKSNVSGDSQWLSTKTKSSMQSPR